MKNSSQITPGVYPWITSYPPTPEPDSVPHPKTTKPSR
jgi:hypothetical protein